MTIFDVSSRNLKELPKVPLGTTVINCSYNQIEEIPDGSVPNTVYCICCEFNQLKKLPQLPKSVKEIYIYGNNIQYLPTSTGLSIYMTKY